MKRRHLDVLPPEPGAAEARVERRHVLGALVAGAAFLQSACSTSSPSFGTDAGSASDSGSTDTNCDSPVGDDLGDVSTFAVGTWTPASTAREPLIVAQDQDGVYVYTAVCTHQGCKIGAPNATGTATCPCHGAQYDGNGTVTKGPARQSLVHYAVAICGGHVFVDTGTTVDASTRAAVS